MNFFKKVINIIVIGLITINFIACPPDGKETKDIFSITISNIPEFIPVHNGAGEKPTFKVWVNASDDQDPNIPPAAQGYTYVEDYIPDNGKFTVSVELKKPVINANTGYYIPGNEGWSGKAKYFSIMITPWDVSADGINAIWVKGGPTLDKSKANQDWDSNKLTWMDFREAGFVDKTTALYDAIICNDPYIKTTP